MSVHIIVEKQLAKNVKGGSICLHNCIKAFCKECLVDKYISIPQI